MRTKRRRVSQEDVAKQFIKLKKDRQGFRVQEIPSKGRGVITDACFEKGEFLLDYQGRVCTAKEGDLLEEKNSSRFRFFFKFKGKEYCYDFDVGNLPWKNGTKMKPGREDAGVSDKESDEGQKRKHDDDTDDNNQINQSSTPKDKQKKTPWTSQERGAVHRHLGHYIAALKLPGKAAIEKCKSLEPCLHNRRWTNIKDYIRNQICSNARKGQKNFAGK